MADALRNVSDAFGLTSDQTMLIVPAVAEHCPRADQQVSALLFVPKGAVNAGDVGGNRTAVLQKF